MAKTLVAITAMPPRTIEYFDWLITGLGILQEQGQIELRFEDPGWEKFLRMHPIVMRSIRRYSSQLVGFVSPIDYTCLTGRVEVGDKVATFAMDIADSPFNFCLGYLESADLYFKCQCPTHFDREGFVLNRHLRIPYHPEVFSLQHKIRPAMLGRPLGHGTNLRKNLRVLRDWEASASANKDIRLFASFAADRTVGARNSRQPLPAPHNYHSENTLLARFGDKIHHPNPKRDRVVEMLRAMGKSDINARIWKSDNPVIGGPMLSAEEYQQTVGRSSFNVNISGLRRSLPFRFMDTFMTGGAVATDTLAIRWYREFEMETEVFEIGDLGYELNQEVDWKAVQQRLNDLYDFAGRNKENHKRVLDLYQKKWTPQAFASHLVKECVMKIDGHSQPNPSLTRKTPEPSLSTV